MMNQLEHVFFFEFSCYNSIKSNEKNSDCKQLAIEKNLIQMIINTTKRYPGSNFKGIWFADNDHPDKSIRNSVVITVSRQNVSSYPFVMDFYPEQFQN